MTVYALRHPDGRWLYNLPKPEGDGFYGRPVLSAFADGQPMTRLHGDWWAADHEAQELSLMTKAGTKTLRYTLTDLDTMSVKYPAVLSVETYQARYEREDELYALYDPVTEETDPLVHVYDGPVMVLEGREPPAPDQLQWKAQLPHELGTRPEYRHLFPGEIPGFRAHLYEVIKAMPSVRHCFDGYHGYVGLHVTVEVPFDQPQTRWQADISRRTSKPLKTGRNVPVIVTRSLDLPVPASVPGPNYEAALAAWEQQVEFWLGVVRSATVTACSACLGTGHVAEGAEKYNHR